MVQKGLEVTAKSAQAQQQQSSELLQVEPDPLADNSIVNQHHHHHQQQQTQTVNTADQLLTNHTAMADTNQLDVQGLDQSIQLNQLVPLPNMDNIKLEVPQFQQVTQVLVSESEMGEPILFCQPTIMLDPSQVIPVTAHSFTSHFVQLHPPNMNNQQGQYL